MRSCNRTWAAKAGGIVLTYHDDLDPVGTTGPKAHTVFNGANPPRRTIAQNFQRISRLVASNQLFVVSIVENGVV